MFRTALIVVAATAACVPRGAAGPAREQVAAAAQDAFFENLRVHCGNAYRGALAVAPPGDRMLRGDETLIVHFRGCGQDTLLLPFHIDRGETWDRSRTWMFMRTSAALEIRHDHRRPDGTPDDQTMYGAFTQEPGTAHRQEFILTERRAPDGALLGWRVEIEPHRRYTYGTIRGGAWTWRVDFDLTQPVAAPPAPWGHR